MPENVGYGPKDTKPGKINKMLEAAKRKLKRKQDESQAGFKKGVPSIPITGTN